MSYVTVNFAARSVNGVRATNTDIALLAVFVERAGEAVSKADLYRATWGYVPLDDYGQITSRALTQSVLRLKRKGVPLETIWGFGWILPSEALASAR